MCIKCTIHHSCALLNELYLSEMKKQCQNYVTLWIDFELKWTSFKLKWTGTKNTSKMLSAKKYQHLLSIRPNLERKRYWNVTNKVFYISHCIGLDICLIKRSWVFFLYYTWFYGSQFFVCFFYLSFMWRMLISIMQKTFFPQWARQLPCSIEQYTAIYRHKLHPLKHYFYSVPLTCTPSDAGI